MTLFFRRMAILSLIFVPSVFFLSNCEKETKEKKAIYISQKFPLIMNVGDLLDERTSIKNIKEFIDTIEIIPLETSDFCLLKYIRGIVFNDDYIYIGQVDGLYQFNSYGEFIQQIGVRGKGPHEYTQMRGFVIKNDSIFINGANKLMLFDENGYFLNEIPFPDILYFEKFDNYYVTYDSEKGKYFFYKNIKLLSSFICDYDTGFNTKPVMIIYPNTTVFIRDVNLLLMTNDYNDTIWKVKSPDDIELRYVINLGKYRLPSKYRVEHVGKNFQKLSSPYLRKCVYSTTNYIVITLCSWYPWFPDENGEYPDEYLCIYDKCKNKTFVVSNKDGSINKPVFVPFSSDGDQYLITYKYAFEIADYIEQLKKNSLPVISFEQFSGKIKDDDNPVIIKVKLKQ